MKFNPRHISHYVLRGAETFVSFHSNYRILPRPSAMYVELTYRCNCRCKFCERWTVSPDEVKEELNQEEVKRLLAAARGLGVRFVGFTGGEPFLRKDIFEIARFARRIGLSTTVASNGTLINRENVKEVASLFDSIAISMDGINESTHDLHRGVKGTHARAMNAIALLAEHRIPVAVNMVVTQKNFTELDQYAQHFAERGIAFQFTPVHSYETSYLKADNKLLQIDLDAFEKIWTNLLSKYRSLRSPYYKSVPAYFSRPERLVESYVCFAGTVTFFVNPYGEVYPCEFNRVSMGNVKKEPLSAIWRNGQRIRREISSPERSCLCWVHCSVPLNIALTVFITPWRMLRSRLQPSGKDIRA